MIDSGPRSRLAKTVPLERDEFFNPRPSFRIRTVSKFFDLMMACSCQYFDHAYSTAKPVDYIYEIQTWLCPISEVFHQGS